MVCLLLLGYTFDRRRGDSFYSDRRVGCLLQRNDDTPPNGYDKRVVWAVETLVHAALANACSMACGGTVKWNIEASLFCTYNDKTADLWNLNG